MADTATEVMERTYAEMSDRRFIMFALARTLALVRCSPLQLKEVEALRAEIEKRIKASTAPPDAPIHRCAKCGFQPEKADFCVIYEQGGKFYCADCVDRERTFDAIWAMPAVERIY